MYLIFFCVLAVLVSASSKTSKKALVSLDLVNFHHYSATTTQAIGAYIYGHQK
jgi:ABC-2 type transport system permease protein